MSETQRADLEWRRWLRRQRRDTLESFRESQWRLPALGTVIGVLLGLWLALWGDPPQGWSVSVGGARNGLLSLLAIVFTGLSIVLAVSSVTAQNVISRYSLRMMRIYLRESRDTTVVAVFALTATFILTVIVQFRQVPVDDLAPVGGIAVSVILLVVSGATMIWHISATVSWFRVDLAVQRVSDLTLRTAQNLGRQHHDDVAIDDAAFRQPSDGVPIRAADSGYLMDVDTGGLFELATGIDAVIVVDKNIGASVVAGEVIGWIDRRVQGEDELLESIRETVDISGLRDPGQDPAYGLVVLVDIAIMALSPAVNDPNTAVQVIEGLTFLLPELAATSPGPFGRLDSGGDVRAAARALEMKDYLDIALTQLALYGASDPAVRSALRRLAVVLSDLDLDDAARRVVGEFSDEIGIVNSAE